MPFCLLLLLWVLSPAHATPRAIQTLQPTPVYVEPDDAGAILYVLPKAAKLWRYADEGHYARVKFKRAGDWVEGFVHKKDLETDSSSSSAAPAPDKILGLGLIGAFSYLQQDGKTFQTDDGVQYKISAYTSQTVWPAFNLQLFEKDFWRLRIGPRTTKFKGQAATDLTGAPTQLISISHQMLSVGLERVWSFSWLRGGYLGLAAEFDRASSMIIQLGGRALVTSREDLPVYLGGGVTAGYQGHLMKSVTYFGELRIETFFNQSPSVGGAELALGLNYWL